LRTNCKKTRPTRKHGGFFRRPGEACHENPRTEKHGNRIGANAITKGPGGGPFEKGDRPAVLVWYKKKKKKKKQPLTANKTNNVKEKKERPDGKKKEKGGPGGPKTGKEARRKRGRIWKRTTRVWGKSFPKKPRGQKEGINGREKKKRNKRPINWASNYKGKKQKRGLGREEGGGSALNRVRTAKSQVVVIKKGSNR